MANEQEAPLPVFHEFADSLLDQLKLCDSVARKPEWYLNNVTVLMGKDHGWLSVQEGEG